MRDKEFNTKRISAKIKPSTKRAIEKLVEKEQRTESFIIRRALERDPVIRQVLKQLAA